MLTIFIGAKHTDLLVIHVRPIYADNLQSSFSIPLLSFNCCVRLKSDTSFSFALKNIKKATCVLVHFEYDAETEVQLHQEKLCVYSRLCSALSNRVLRIVLTYTLFQKPILYEIICFPRICNQTLGSGKMIAFQKNHFSLSAR